VIAAVSDPGRARGYYEKASRLDPTNIEGEFWNGWFQQDAGNLVKARAAYDCVITSAVSGNDDGFLFWARMGIGDVLVAQGNLPEALKSFRDGLAIADRLAKSDPGNAGWQRDLSVSYAKLAYAFTKSGEESKALEALRQGRAIMVRMTSLSPDNAVWKRDLDWFDNQIAQAAR
jgi:tetratricopeptide (TPR) repeat protein